ncbi:sulfur carrier protein ThiS [uncultured Eubacterium sp.]|uniref:sulfur carrier protein ThiS n=1 Tax=uncultured Eubacterium sp. TaxID=165185 RepID=UPI000E91D74B|nr:sulfur carrier protein ThiS [uncultured Eubacterium sp.]HAV89899.1 thiamine biosynthesis protein ThiS [Eubacterium sp.]
MVKINGEMYDYANLSITDMLNKFNYNPQRVAVEVNLEIIPKSEYDNHVLSDEDSVEVVQFVGGG